MAKKIFYAVFIVCFCLVGCKPQVMVKQLDDISRQPVTGDIDVYNSLEEIQRQYTRIAELEIEHSMAFRKSEKQMIDSLITKAKELGADAIVILKKGNKEITMSDPTGGGKISTLYPFINAAAIVDKM